MLTSYVFAEKIMCSGTIICNQDSNQCYYETGEPISDAWIIDSMEHFEALKRFEQTINSFFPDRVIVRSGVWTKQSLSLKAVVDRGIRFFHSIK